VNIEWATVIEAGVPIAGGLYATALGYGWVKPFRSATASRQRVLAHLRWLGPVVMLFGVFTGWRTHTELAHPSADVIARGIAARMSFPVRVDDITTADAVTGEANTITYHYYITGFFDDEERARMKQSIGDQLLAVTCKDAQALTLLSGGYTIERRYRFQGNDGFSSLIDARTCAP
jgi:hypothetical protein